MLHNDKKIIYAGIGSRETPADILKLMQDLAEKLARSNCILRSGGADGADTAFEQGCDLANGQKEIYLPWRGFNNNKSQLFDPSNTAYKIASETHPGFTYLKSPAKLLMARNTHQILGEYCDTPVDLILCWTPDGATTKTSSKTGGTGQALRLAAKYNIPIYNLQIVAVRKAWQNWLENISSPE
jgi:hypothetical protein